MKGMRHILIKKQVFIDLCFALIQKTLKVAYTSTHWIKHKMIGKKERK